MDGQHVGSSWSVHVGETESQNHRMFRVGRNLCGSPSPTPLPKQGHLQQAAQDLGQTGFEYLQRRRLHSLPGQPGPGLRHPQREEVLPPVQLELPLLQFVPVAPCPVTGHHWKESGPILLTLPRRYLEAFLRSPLSLLFSRLKKPSSLSLSSQERCSSPLLILVAHSLICFIRLQGNAVPFQSMHLAEVTEQLFEEFTIHRLTVAVEAWCRVI